MRKRQEGVINKYNQLRASFLKGSMFYGLSLDKRPSIFDSKKFINDPWPGNVFHGKDLLAGIFRIDDNEVEVDMLDAIACSNKISPSVLMYVNSFVWMRDLQLVGGNNVRKYSRAIVSRFIENYKGTKKFWSTLPSWELSVTAERIVNWMLSYSFFAMGADDQFQKDVLSSIAEQYSHISKMYKTETNPLIKLMLFKAMFFCLCSMKNNNKRQIKQIINEVEKIVIESLDEFGMYYTRNPNDHFGMFRHLLEIRFMARSHGVDLSKDVFYDRLSKMASCIRLLRLGDGTLSSHPGDMISSASVMNQARSHIIDTSLSLVDINYGMEDRGNVVTGFDRISTKKITVIINNKVFDVRSHFNHPREPGINIFDFEASFQTQRLINRSDISILLKDGYRIKATKNSDPYVRKEIDSKNITCSCEISNLERQFQFAIRRDISISLLNPRLFVSDFVYTSLETDAFIRVTLNKDVYIEQLNNMSAVIKCHKKSYRFSMENANSKLLIKNKNVSIYPSIVVVKRLEAGKESQIDWAIEDIS